MSCPTWVRGNMKKVGAGQVSTGRKDMGSLFHGVKGYADGGEVLKQEGLKASAGEKVGLLERLKMGNIDDPNSKAYAQFGAGRGAAEANRNAPSYDQTDDAKNLTPKTTNVVTDEQRRKAEADTDVSPMEKVQVNRVAPQAKAETKPKPAPKQETTKASTPSKASTGGQSDTGAQEGASKTTAPARSNGRGRAGRAGSSRSPGFFESLMDGIKNPDNPRIRREREEMARASKD